MIHVIVTLDDRDQAIVTSTTAFDARTVLARTLSAHDPVADQREALLAVLGSVCDRVAEALEVDLQGVDLTFVDVETRREATS